jgi:hypothetical protein
MENCCGAAAIFKQVMYGGCRVRIGLAVRVQSRVASFGVGALRTFALYDVPDFKRCTAASAAASNSPAAATESAATGPAHQDAATWTQQQLQREVQLHLIFSVHAGIEQAAAYVISHSALHLYQHHHQDVQQQQQQSCASQPCG